MEVVYRLNEKDLLASIRFMGKISPLVKRVHYTGILIVAALPCLHFLVKSLAERQFTLWNVVDLVIELLLMAIVYVLVISLITPIIHRQVVATLKKKDGGVLRESKISLTEDALIASTSVSESRLGWIDVVGTYQNESYIIIMTGSQQGYVIPKRAFVNDEAASQFHNQANEFYQNAQRV